MTRLIRGLTPEEVTRSLDAARVYATKLPSASGRVGVLGFCWGGALSFEYAPAVSAAVVFYGSSPSDPALLARIKAPVLGHYGGDDARVNTTIEPAAAEMKKLGRTYETHLHEGAGHGFLRQQAGRDGANLKASQAAWPSVVGFLRESLK